MSQTAYDELIDAAQSHHEAGRFSEAAEFYRQAVQLEPEDSLAIFLLGLATFQLGDPRGAADLIRRAIALDPSVPEYHCDLGRILLRIDDSQGSIAASRKAIELRPEFPQAQLNLGHALSRHGAFSEAVQAYDRALALGVTSDALLNNLGMAHFELGNLDEAISCFEGVLKINPRDAAADSNRIYALHFHPAWTAAAIRAQLDEWNNCHAKPLRPLAIPGPVNHGPGRPLRIGYVSPDLREHVVGWNILPILAEHDRQKFEITCYSDVVRPDGVTERLRSRCDNWRDIHNRSDDQVADLIRADGIDVLIDLTLHMGGNRLLVFARKPAPVQVTYLAYPGSSGLTTMDYRLSDPFLDTSADLASYSEQTLYLPRTYWCYNPGGPTPGAAPLPALANGHITFGSLNAFKKVSGPTLDLWARLLAQVPQSRLILQAPTGECRARVLRVFAGFNIAAERIEFVGRNSWPQYVQTYSRIDVGLDPFPYGGGITTCDALWMGVPVITLRGQTSVGRGATSVLSVLRLQQFVATSTEGCIAVAKAAIADLEQLALLRSQLRERMLRSDLMNVKGFTHDFEQALLNAWHNALGRTQREG